MRRAIALLDWFLLSRHGRRLRRWSFLVTAPFVLEGDTALLPARRRVDLWIDLTEPVTVTRPLGEPVQVRRIGLAADDPVALGLPELVHGSA